jgi:glycosyltransferase involved in cell wall biosynthesis
MWRRWTVRCSDDGAVGARVRVLLLSAYDAPSQRYWREGLASHLPDVNFTQLALPPRYFSWRIRGNSLSWAWSQRELLQRDYQLLVATSTVDLSALRGFVPALAALPTLIYCHENQFAYPTSGREHHSLEPRVVNLYSALCADRVVFNSGWNRDSFLAGAAELLRRLPDQVPPGLVAQLAGRSEVLPVPLEPAPPPQARRGLPLEVVWNHRWEYDKGPQALLALVRQSVQRGLPLRFHIVGQQFRRAPAEFEALRALLAAHPHHAGQWGSIARREDYLALLERAHVVISTARHEFQGLAVMEAALRGCLPLVPDRLSYREYFDAAWRYPSTPDQPEREALAMVQRLQALAASWPAAAGAAAAAMRRCTWPALAPGYRALLASCAAAHLPSPRQ